MNKFEQVSRDGHQMSIVEEVELGLGESHVRCPGAGTAASGGRISDVLVLLNVSGVFSGGGGCLLPRGVSAPGGMSAPERGVCSGGVSGLGGVCIPACTEADTPPVNRMTHKCKNITFANFVCGR